MAMHNVLPANCCSKEKMPKCWETLTCIYHLYMTYMCMCILISMYFVSRGWTFTIFFSPLQTMCHEFSCILIYIIHTLFFILFVFILKEKYVKSPYKVLFPFYSGVWIVMWYHGIELYFFMVRTTVVCACTVDSSIKLLCPSKRPHVCWRPVLVFPLLCNIYTSYIGKIVSFYSCDRERPRHGLQISHSTGNTNLT